MSNGSWTAVGLQTGLPNQGQNSLGPFSFVFSATENDTVQSLTTGNNSITVPSTAAGLWIVPPVGNAVTLTLKGANADTGIALDPAGPTFVNFSSSPPATLVIDAGGSVAVGFRFT